MPGEDIIVIDEDYSLDYSTDYTVIAVDEVAGPVRPLVIANPSDARLGPGNFFAQVVHAAPSAPQLNGTSPCSVPNSTPAPRSTWRRSALKTTPRASKYRPALTRFASPWLMTSTKSSITPVKSRCRLAHASPNTGNVDIYLVTAGTDISDVAPNFAAVPFGAYTGVLSIAPETYDVYVTGADNKIPAIEALGVTLSGGEVWDIIARDAEPETEESGPQPVIVDYRSDELPICTVGA